MQPATGLAIGECLHAAGAHLHLLDLDADALARVSGSSGERVTTAAVDVSNPPLLRETIDAVAASRGSLDIVVANAGVTAGPGYLTDAGQINAVEDERWDRVVDVNMSGVFATIQAAAKHMKQQRSGRIVAESSVAGLRSEVMCGYAYAATKAAVVNLVRQAAMELAQYNVMVNGIAPGPFRTNIAGGRIRQPEVEAQLHPWFRSAASPNRMRSKAWPSCWLYPP